jgi:hypothetical protein
MNKKDYLIIFIITTIPFIAYLLNPQLVGADSYFYINQICEITPQHEYNFLFATIIQFFPCNTIFLKLFMFTMWFGCLTYMAKIGELYDKERGILAPLIMAGMTLFILSFFNFENDLIGYLFFFASLFHLLKYDKQKSMIDLILSILLIIGSGLFWNGAVYWLVVFPLFWIGYIPIAAIMLFTNFERFFFFINANRGIAEHAMFISIIYWGMAVLFLYGIKKTDKKIALCFLILCIPALFIVKLYVLCIPFIVLIAFNAIRDLKIDKTQLLYMLMAFAILNGALFGSKTFDTFPTTKDVEVIKTAIDFNEYTQNTFGVGYAIVHYGGIPSSFGGLGNNDYECSGYVIEHVFKTDCNCPVFLKGDTILLEKC